MAYAKTYDEGRIAAWSREPAEGFDAEFSNPEELDVLCTDGVDDFVVRDGKAVYDPPPEKEQAALEAVVAKSGAMLARLLLDMTAAKNLGQLLQVFSRHLDAHRDEFKTLAAALERLEELKE